MASKSIKNNNDSSKENELNNIISDLKKDLKEKTEENKRLQSSNKSIENKRATLSKQSDNYLKKQKEMEEYIAKLKEDISLGKSEIANLKKENNKKELLEKQEISRELKELKKKEKELEAMHLSIDKEIAALGKLKKDTKHSADTISKVVAKMPERQKLREEELNNPINNNNSLKFDFEDVDKVLDKLGTILQDVTNSIPPQQVTVVPMAQSAGDVEATNKAIEDISSYIKKSEIDPKFAPPPIVLSPQTIITQPIKGSTPLEERDPTAMLSKPREESRPISDMPVMRMQLDKDEDIYEDRLVITYTFDNMPEYKLYSKYKKILRNAVRTTLLGNLQEGLDLFKIIKQQNLTEEYKSMIDKNIADITYYLRGQHRVRIE